MQSTMRTIQNNKVYYAKTTMCRLHLTIGKLQVNYKRYEITIELHKITIVLHYTTLRYIPFLTSILCDWIYVNLPRTHLLIF